MSTATLKAKKPLKSKAKTADWENRKKAQSVYQAKVSAEGRDIGSIPDVKDQDRRDRCERKFKLFCEEYMPASFPLNWSADHLKVITKIEDAVLRGELLAIAMPRGSGKTTLVEAATIWAVLYAHRSFITIIGADEPSAEQMLDSITTELETNEILLEDFPEVCFPISKLDGIHHRAPGQICAGERTRMEWSKKRIVLPTVKDPILGGNYPTSGCIIDVTGITGRIRGRKHKRADGVQTRPDLVLIDDPQTDDVAKSPSQINQRLKILNGAILGLAGPGKKISGLCTVTVIAPDDMADQMLDAKKYPQWRGERTKLVYSFPTNEKLWEEYAKLRIQDFERDDGDSHATQFYLHNRAAMDEGAKVAWPERKNKDEISALQHAMNLKYQDLVAFQSEYQNDPLPLVNTSDTDLSLEILSQQFNGLPDHTAFIDATHLGFGIDVHKDVLYYSSIACADDLTGNIPLYGTWPKQNRKYFTLRDSKLTLSTLYPGRTLEEQIQLGLADLIKHIMTSRFTREDGSLIHVSKILIDSGFEAEAVYDFCRRSEYASVVMPFKGVGIKASDLPMEDKPVKRGDKTGTGWRVPAKQAGAKAGIRLLLADSNMWKAKLCSALVRSIHERGSITLFDKAPSVVHDLIFDHFMAEYAVDTEGRGRKVREYKLKPGDPDNHYFDATYMAYVACSSTGAGVVSKNNAAFTKKKQVSFTDMQKKAREARR